MSIAVHVTHGRIYQSPNAYIVHTYMPTFNTYFIHTSIVNVHSYDNIQFS